MKVTITVASYWPLLDGVQMVTQYQAEGLVKKGYEVVVITSKVDGVPNEEYHNGVKIIRVDAHNWLYWHRGNKSQFQSVVLKECSNSMALIAVCLQSYAADWVIPILDNINCKKVVYMHGMPDFKLHRSDMTSIYNIFKTLFRNLRWLLFYKLHWKGVLKFDVAIHLFKNDNSYSYFEKNGFENNYVIENSCDNIFFEKSHNYMGGNKNFLYVGNYCQRKNQIGALRAFYKTQNKDVSFTFCGSSKNKYYQSLVEENQKLIKKYGFRKVNILVGISRNEIIDLTLNAYAAIMSSTFEFYPIVVVESIASGVPFISTNVGVLRFLPGGIIVDSINDMAYWIDLLASNEILRNDIGQVGKKFAHNHLKLENKIEQLSNIIKD